jgi:hypothetical protein
MALTETALPSRDIMKVGKACGMYGGDEPCIQGFGGETWRKETVWMTEV